MVTFTLVSDNRVHEVLNAVFGREPHDSDSVGTFLRNDHVRAIADFDETIRVRKVD